ncbi:hypothetical protein BUY79_02325 [Staphylococcus equorum]|uniref:hypothetical protein n=1 Tax=Staphylococcus equorum TaxID=246432 RepID=UPI000D1C9497|nr:hypothetical protein [Staphylococcus equorum]PTE42208.1 hypothetical protein BUY77_10795 [Staphylococcus equorum]PTE85604.1 hypothetical protein BUY79_02325 [Staphylococcus equorum]PTF11179.1 hypothetical protein BUY81_07495 [Staphylococcus equorum]RIL48270.1 hypothetical protein BUY82_05675 [Staphylococcus equorum]
MTEENNKQHNPKDPGHRGGGPGGEKRSNEPARKSYRNHTHDHETLSESNLEEKFGKGFRKDRK